MGICPVGCAWPSSQLLNGVSGKAHSGSAPICTLWVLYLAGSECVGGGVLECSYVMCWYTCISAGVCIGCCVCMCEAVVCAEGSRRREAGVWW